MTNSTVIALEKRGSFKDELTEFLRASARELVANAVETEVAELLSAQAARKLPDGRSAVVRNGYQPEREIVTGIGAVPVQIPRVRSRDGEPVSFRSVLVPPYVRRSRSLNAAIPWLYLKGVAAGEMSVAHRMRRDSYHGRQWVLMRGSPALSEAGRYPTRTAELFALGRGQWVGVAVVVPVRLGCPVADRVRWGRGLASPFGAGSVVPRTRLRQIVREHRRPAWNHSAALVGRCRDHRLSFW